MNPRQIKQKETMKKLINHNRCNDKEQATTTELRLLDLQLTYLL